MSLANFKPKRTTMVALYRFFAACYIYLLPVP